MASFYLNPKLRNDINQNIDILINEYFAIKSNFNRFDNLLDLILLIFNDESSDFTGKKFDQFFNKICSDISAFAQHKTLSEMLILLITKSNAKNYLEILVKNLQNNFDDCFLDAVLAVLLIDNKPQILSSSEIILNLKAILFCILSNKSLKNDKSLKILNVLSDLTKNGIFDVQVSAPNLGKFCQNAQIDSNFVNKDFSKIVLTVLNIEIKLLLDKIEISSKDEKRFSSVGMYQSLLGNILDLVILGKIDFFGLQNLLTDLHENVFDNVGKHFEEIDDIYIDPLLAIMVRWLAENIDYGEKTPKKLNIVFKIFKKRENALFHFMPVLSYHYLLKEDLSQIIFDNSSVCIAINKISQIADSVISTKKCLDSNQIYCYNNCIDLIISANSHCHVLFSEQLEKTEKIFEKIFQRRSKFSSNMLRKSLFLLTAIMSFFAKTQKNIKFVSEKQFLGIFRKIFEKEILLFEDNELDWNPILKNLGDIFDCSEFIFDKNEIFENVEWLNPLFEFQKNSRFMAEHKILFENFLFQIIFSGDNGILFARNLTKNYKKAIQNNFENLGNFLIDITKN
ncbi:hypothetical protein MHBO_000914 [Bonamia ostreae]